MFAAVCFHFISFDIFTETNQRTYLPEEQSKPFFFVSITKGFIKMANSKQKSGTQAIARTAKLYPDGKEDLQRSISFFFGDGIENLKEGSQQFKAAMLKLAALGVVGSAFFYYLLIFHT